MRGGDGTSFDNFTILANEVATIDTKKYHVWTTPGDIYSIRVSWIHANTMHVYA